MKGRIPVNLTPWWSATVEAQVKATLPAVKDKQTAEDERTLRLGLHVLQTDDHVMTGLRLYASQPGRKIGGRHADQGHLTRISYVLQKTQAHLMTQGHVDLITQMPKWPTRIMHGMPVNTALHKVQTTKKASKRLLQILENVINLEWKKHHIANPNAPAKPLVNLGMAKTHTTSTRRPRRQLSSAAIRSAQALSHTHGLTERARQRNDAMLKCKEATNYRLPELAALRLPDLRALSNGGLHFKAPSGKTHNVRSRRCGRVPATRAWYDLRMLEDDSDVLWTDDNGAALTIKEIKTIITQMGDTPYGKVSPHDWKRWDLGLRSASGQPRSQVASAGHHGAYSCTSTYIQPADDILYMALASAWGINPNALGDCCRTCGTLDYVVLGLCERHRLAQGATPEAVDEQMEGLALQALEDLDHLRDLIAAQMAASTRALGVEEQANATGA